MLYKLSKDMSFPVMDFVLIWEKLKKSFLSTVNGIFFHPDGVKSL